MTTEVIPLIELKHFLCSKSVLRPVPAKYKGGDAVTLAQCCATLDIGYLDLYGKQSPGSYYDPDYYKFLRFGPTTDNESHYKDTHPHRVTLTIKDPAHMNLKLDWPIL